MVPPTFNRVRGKTKEQRIRDNKRKNKANLKQAGKLKVSALSPPAGPLAGGTRVVVVGSGYRNFGPLMRCRFGNQEVRAHLSDAGIGYIDPFNHTLIGCEAPEAPTPLAQEVALEVSLNGQDYSSAGLAFHYYRHPAVVSLSPARGSAAMPQVLTLSRRHSADSGGWSPAGNRTERTCRFEAVVLPDGKRQRQWARCAGRRAAVRARLRSWSDEGAVSSPPCDAGSAGGHAPTAPD